MPVPLNPFVDVAKCWFTERLGYLVNDSVPVKPAYHDKPNTPSDIDIVCMHPRRGAQITFPSGRKVRLGKNLLVECKGWFDFYDTSFMSYLVNDLALLKKHKNVYLPLDLTKDDFYFFFLRKEVFDKGREIFGTGNFHRTIIGPLLKPTRTVGYDALELISEFERRNIIIVEMRDVIQDLFLFISKARMKRKKMGSSGDWDKLRKNYALEMLHLINTFCNVNRK